ncbi:MAG: TlpA family protein disulfide reductase, partial [Acidimicrobiia bacterium]|nr:TlpA family protein disulfide reductase [Acidimicrobiia bacterium]
TDGRPIFLNLWASWCPPCRAEMPAIDAVAQRHPNVLFLGIAVQDDPVAAEEFAREVGVSYPLGIDERDIVDASFGVLGLPTSYLISGEGVILTEIIGEVDEERIDGVLASFLGG